MLLLMYDFLSAANPDNIEPLYDDIEKPATNIVGPLPKHIGFSFYCSPARLLITDEYQTVYQRKTNAFTVGAQLDFSYVPSDNNVYASDYGYPLFSLGARYSFNDITMRRPDNVAWGKAQTVDYVSRMGNNFTVYGAFSRYLFRARRWSADISIGTGLTYSRTKYNKHNNVDNELLGSNFLIYFSGGIHATYHFSDLGGVVFGLDFYHHSNGALNRPNKGANLLGPVVGLRYSPYYEEVRERKNIVKSEPFKRKWFANVAIGLGGKTLLEDWLKTQYQTSPDSSRYRTGNFKLYATYSMQANIMYRYARRWASGLGADVYYVTYASRINEIEKAAKRNVENSKPWSLGLSAKHQAYFGNLSVAMALGFYLYRKLGTSAKEIERPIYENIGLRYGFPKIGGLEFGFNLKAHKLKADYTELLFSYPIAL